MTKAYNFLASWQLFPEKSKFENGIVPKSGNYKIESINNGEKLSISIYWTSITNESFYSQYYIIPNGLKQPFENTDFATEVLCEIIDKSTFKTLFYKEDVVVLEVVNEILANGYMKITQKGFTDNNTPFVNVEIYHKQMSVLPYSSSSSSVAVKPTNEGIIKHKALYAMEEQTNMQLNQIKEQIELLARQAQAIRNRKEISMMIYEAKLNFKPQIGHTYHLYENKDFSHVLSMVAPQEWGEVLPFNKFISSVQLLADHTWKEVN